MAEIHPDPAPSYDQAEQADYATPSGLSKQQDAIANAAADLRIALDAVPSSTVHWAVEDARRACRSLVLLARTIRTDDVKGANLEKPPVHGTPQDAIADHLAAMEDWVAGRRSTWNTHATVTDVERRSEALTACAQEDAAHVAMHAEAIRAYASLVGTGVVVHRAAVAS